MHAGTPPVLLPPAFAPPRPPEPLPPVSLPGGGSTQSPQPASPRLHTSAMELQDASGTVRTDVHVAGVSRTLTAVPHMLGTLHDPRRPENRILMWVFRAVSHLWPETAHFGGEAPTFAAHFAGSKRLRRTGDDGGVGIEFARAADEVRGRALEQPATGRARAPERACRPSARWIARACNARKRPGSFRTCPAGAPPAVREAPSAREGACDR